MISLYRVYCFNDKIEKIKLKNKWICKQDKQISNKQNKIKKRMK